MGAFGEKLRKQREQRGLELDAISNTTKISTRMLRALEDEHFDQLPGGVFNKGFVRAYARQIGLDEEEAVADYLTALRESQIQQQSILPDFRGPAGKPAPVAAPDLGHKLHTSEPRDKIITSDELPADRNDDGDGDNHELRADDRRSQGRRNQDRRSNNEPKYPAGDPAQPADQSSTPVPWGKLAFTLLVVTLALAFWNFRRHNQPTSASSAAASPTVAATNQPPVPASTQVPAATQPPRQTAPATAPASSPNPVSSAKLPEPSASSSAKETAVNLPQPDLKPPATRATARAATPKPPTITLTLLIRAEQTTWIALTVDGKPITQETLIAPAHTSVRASREIVVRAGNASGISFQLNGKEIPAQGNAGEVKTYVFDATGVHVTSQAQPPATNRQD